MTSTLADHLEKPAPAGDEDAARSFSLVLGGPLYQLFLRAHMVREPMGLLARRVIVISLLGWAPLLIAALAAGRAVGGTAVPFVLDVATHVRFLISLPLLIVAEWLVHIRLRPLMGQFTGRDLIKPQDRSRFRQIIDSALGLRNSVAAELVLVLVVFTGGYLVWRTQGSLQTSTWYAEGAQLTLAGKVYAYWSTPLFQFILLRWYFRVFIWARFLFQVSRLDLNLTPTHPDRAGGLGFLAASAHALMPLLVAQSAVVSGVIANRIFFEGRHLTDFKVEILVLLVFLLLLALGPMLVFAPMLLRCQRVGRGEYGALASRYVSGFDQKWVRREAETSELLGSGDIQSLADLANSYQVIDSMNPFPFGRSAVIRLAIVSALPLLPLVLTVVPLEQLIDRLFSTLL